MTKDIIILLLSMALCGSAHAQEREPERIAGDVLVMLAPEGRVEVLAEDLRALLGMTTGSYTVEEVSAPMRIWRLRFDPERIPEQWMLRAANGHPHVIAAQFNHVVHERHVPNDTRYDEQWHHQLIGSENAWAVSTGGSTVMGDTIVACIIERSDLPHPDLSGNAWYNHAEIPGNGIDDDGNGYVDDHRGWNPASGNDEVYGGTHGTQVAGMIGAKGGNGLGVVGANWDVKMMVVHYGGTTEAEVLAAYTYPLVMRRRYNASNGQQGAFVVATNASWGINGGQPSQSPLWCAMYDTLGTAGILSCGATANNDVNVDVVGDMPTACPSEFLVSVTATDVNDVRNFAAYGANTIDLAAPGRNVLTTTQGGGYGTASGTSFASPLTAGVVALLYSAPCSELMGLVKNDPKGGALFIRKALLEGVDLVEGLQGRTVTGGRLNAGRSMELVMEGCDPCPPPFDGHVSRTGPDGVAEFTWSTLFQGPFDVRYRMLGEDEWTERPGVAAPPFQVAGLDRCSAYEFQVAMACPEGERGYSASMLLLSPEVSEPVIFTDGREWACTGDRIVLTTSVEGDITWSTGDTSQALLVLEGGTYWVTVNDLCGSATSAPVEIGILGPSPPEVSHVSMPGPGIANLMAQGDSVLWYDVPVGGEPVGRGVSWSTPYLSDNTSFWAAQVETSSPAIHKGGPEERTTTGLFQSNTSLWPLFTAYKPFVIRSVKVYANGAGDRTIGLMDAVSGEVLVEGVFPIPDGESRVRLDIEVPAPGDYALRVLSDDPRLWRDGLGSAPSYPYPLGDLGAITGSNAAGAHATAMYFFFYDWEVGLKSISCESPRAQVKVYVSNDGLSLSPNPVQDRLHVELSGATGRQMWMQVLDNTGRSVMERALQDGRAIVSVDGLANGPYICRVMDGSGSQHAWARFVVVR